MLRMLQWSGSCPLGLELTEPVYCVLCVRRISQISSLSKAILAFGKSRSRREPNMGCRGPTDLGDVMVWQKKKACTRAVEWAGALSELAAWESNLFSGNTGWGSEILFAWTVVDVFMTWRVYRALKGYSVISINVKLCLHCSETHCTLWRSWVHTSNWKYRPVERLSFGREV